MRTLREDVCLPDRKEAVTKAVASTPIFGASAIVRA